MAIIGYYIGLLEVPRKLVFSLAHAHVGDYYMGCSFVLLSMVVVKNVAQCAVQWNNIYF